MCVVLFNLARLLRMILVKFILMAVNIHNSKTVPTIRINGTTFAHIVIAHYASKAAQSSIVSQ